MTNSKSIKALFSILMISTLSGLSHAQQASNFGADMALTIRDCTGIAPLDSCVWPGDPPHRQNRSAFINFFSTTENTTINLAEPGYGGGQAGIVFSGDLFTPTLLNMVESTDLSRNGASIFAWQVVTYTGTSPIEVDFGGQFSYTSTGTADQTCPLFKDVDTGPGGFQFTHAYNKNECSSINIILQITDLDLEQVVSFERLQSSNGAIDNPTTIQSTIEMVPGRPYEIYAVVQTIARGVGQMIDSTNSYEIGLIDPDTGLVTKDIPESLPKLRNNLIPASDESQPELIQIDVLPNSPDNNIRDGRSGLIPVALITTSTFFAPDVDRDALQFGPGAALVANKGGGPTDIDGDGDQDYVIHFSAEDAGFSCGDTKAYLSGLTIWDDIIIGSDSINVTGCP